MSRKCWIVYGLICPVTDCLFYIGITQDVEKRLSQHRSDPSSAAYELINDLPQYGKTAQDVKAIVMAHVHSKELALRIESHLIIICPHIANRTHGDKSEAFWDMMEAEFGSPWWRKKPLVVPVPEVDLIGCFGG